MSRGALEAVIGRAVIDEEFRVWRSSPTRMQRWPAMR